MEVPTPTVHAEVSVTTEMAPGQHASPTDPIVGVTPGTVTVKVEQTSVPLVSNRDDPICIDSDEEDAMWREVMRRNPSPAVSDLSDGPDEPAVPEGSERKMSAAKALRVQLSKISADKLSINKDTVHYNRELEFQNLQLKKELEMERALREKERKLREEANESLRGAGMAQVECISSPSAPLTQLTTSVASAPELSGSEAVELSQPGEVEVVPSTQVQRIMTPIIPSHMRTQALD